MDTASGSVIDLARQLAQFDNNSPMSYIRPPVSELPDLAEIEKLIKLLREIVFPGYFDTTVPQDVELTGYLEHKIEEAHQTLEQQIQRGFCFFCFQHQTDCTQCRHSAQKLSRAFIFALPEIRDSLTKDAMAAYTGDPAARHISEAILCYPSLVALTHYRIANKLHLLGAELIPRMISELAHSKTGIDIHPGATIGSHFFIDHGTGVVIGETAIIGDRVRIYQGVTLGAKSFPLDENGNPVKGVPRHPIIGNDVTIYSNATILGRITIGNRATIGGNIWVSSDVAADTIVTQFKGRTGANL